ncbi:MAG: type I 3-dehydroquinate dehydratase, partial [Chthoniobacterales bacterium]
SQLRPSPDLFEVRLDSLYPILDHIAAAIRSLRAPLIITARHPREGGSNNLSALRRATLLRQFLDCAAYIDIELRARRELRSVQLQARRQHIGLIVSVHDFKATPSVSRLRANTRAARAAGADIFKVATRTDTREQLARLIGFFDEPDACRAVAGRRRNLPISAMGIGKLGRVARVELARRGSVLIYAAIGRPRVEGQISLAQLRSALAALKMDAGTDGL